METLETPQVVLRPYQSLMVARHLSLLKVRRVTADRSETGVGKTPVAMAVAKGLEAKVVVVVCPKTLKSHWRMWGKEFGFEKDQLIVVGWEEAKLGKYPELYAKTFGWFRGGRDRSFDADETLIIFDEAHRSKNYKAQNTQMVRAAAQSGAFLYLISATLIQSSLDLGGLAYPLKLIERQSYWFPFAQKYGAGLNAFRAYHDFAAPYQLKELHALLDSVGCRVRKKEVTDRTLCLTQVDLLDSDRVKEIMEIHDELAAKVAELERRKNAAIEIMAARVHARQAVELAKVSIFVGEALKHLEEGAKVALFLNFTESVVEALRQFDAAKFTARSITGSTTLADRDSHIKAFNTGFLHVLVCNIQAGGEGISLHDTDGQYPRVALLSPPESAGILVQALGRIDRVGAMSVGLNRIIFVAGTMEEIVYQNVRRKINKLSTLNDGDLAVKL